MKLVSVNVGLPREVDSRGRIVKTSIWKDPVEGPVRVSKLNLEGDRQSDLLVHGGVDKAIYVYPSEHYAYWRGLIDITDLAWGAFGENFTTEGLLEDQVEIGGVIQAGSAEFVVTQPRTPCFKLGIRFDRLDMPKLFLESKRTGFYLAVVREGEVRTGDAIQYSTPERAGGGLTITDIVNLYTADSDNRELLRRASELTALPAGWRDYFLKRL